MGIVAPATGALCAVLIAFRGPLFYIAVPADSFTVLIRGGYVVKLKNTFTHGAVVF